MCGIAGYIGKNQVKDILLNCLEKSEYRGYDSAGMAILQNGYLKIIKSNGRISKLRHISDKEELKGFVGIGHTRWATHGKPSTANSHPHYNAEKTIAVVHNGIIENYCELRKFLIENGYNFKSDTDTEVIPHLIDYFYSGDLLDAVSNMAKKLEGSYAISVICSKESDKIVTLKKDSPLIIGVGTSGNYITSDTTALNSEIHKVYYMNDNELAIVKDSEVIFYDLEKKRITKDASSFNYVHNTAEKQGFNHFMLKEIYEQPKAVYDTIAERIKGNEKIKINGLNQDSLKDIEKIYIVACGTAYHAGIVGKYAIEKLAGIPTEVEIASEFRYRSPVINSKTLVIAITQSGETADTLIALKTAKQNKAKTLAITNVASSSITRETDYVFYTYAGPEIAVASTKAYLTQLTALYTLAIFISEINGHTPPSFLNKLKKELLNIPYKIKQTLLLESRIKDIANKIFKEKYIFYLGRGTDYAVAMEGSLKLKEISYIHSEAYAGGELKHGPIALIDKGTVVIAINTNSSLGKKMDSNIKEVSTRGARIIGILPKGFEEFEDSFENVFFIPETEDLLYPLLASVPLQLIAYHISVNKKCDVDKPKNLAKSVTVE